MIPADIWCRTCEKKIGEIRPGRYGLYEVQSGQRLHCKACEFCALDKVTKEDGDIEIVIEELEDQTRNSKN